MKKIMAVFLLLLLSVVPVSANHRKEVEFQKCTDGDTAHFMVDGKDTTVRFLAIDTPEYTKEKEPYGKEASEYTCTALKHAKKIELEYDDGSDPKDKYGRALAWVFVDGSLLQKELVEQGLAEVTYIYGEYAYTEELYQAQEEAKAAKLHIWSDTEAKEDIPLYVYLGTAIGALLILLLSISKCKGKKRKIKQVKRAMKKLNQR